jgi:glycerate kinase
MSTRLEELYEKTIKHPELMTTEEALELQGLARVDRAVVGKRTAHKVKAAAKGVKKMSLEELENHLKSLTKMNEKINNQTEGEK